MNATALPASTGIDRNVCEGYQGIRSSIVCKTECFVEVGKTRGVPDAYDQGEVDPTVPTRGTGGLAVDSYRLLSSGMLQLSDILDTDPCPKILQELDDSSKTLRTMLAPSIPLSRKNTPDSRASTHGCRISC